jgi:hypothetical protein
MAVLYKILGQSNPSATTATTLYTVPALANTVCSTISVCNSGSTSATFRIAFRPAGETLATKHYINYDTTVAGNDSMYISLGVTLATTDVITVYASNGNLCFSAFGSEII